MLSFIAVTHADVHLKGHVAGTSQGSVTTSFAADGFSVDIRDNAGTVAFDDGRVVEVVVVYAGNKKFVPHDYDAQLGYKGGSTLAIGAGDSGFGALSTFAQKNAVLAGEIANSDASDTYNLNSAVDGSTYKFDKKKQPNACLDLDVTVPLVPRTDRQCPTVKSNDGQFSLDSTCTGDVGDWQLTVFEFLTCLGCRTPDADYGEFDALLVKGDAVCFATIFATAAGQGTHPITLVPTCISGSWPDGFTSWAGTVSALDN